jgi:UTP-glucose-1-phosphate uridylyltransferase
MLASVSSNITQKYTACADLAFILEQHADVIQDRRILVVASDLLFTTDGFDLEAFLFETAVDIFSVNNVSSVVIVYRKYTRAMTFETLSQVAAPGACLYYIVPDSDVHKRGILEVDEHTQIVTSFLEKPQPDQTPSRKACPVT